MFELGLRTLAHDHPNWRVARQKDAEIVERQNRLAAEAGRRVIGHDEDTRISVFHDQSLDGAADATGLSIPIRVRGLADRSARSRASSSTRRSSIAVVFACR